MPISALAVSEAGKQIDSDYQAVDASVFPLIMRAIAPIKHERFVFVDIGAGKGRAAFLAATYPFKRIIGIELACRFWLTLSVTFTSSESGGDTCSARTFAGW